MALSVVIDATNPLQWTCVKREPFIGGVFTISKVENRQNGTYKEVENRKNDGNGPLVAQHMSADCRDSLDVNAECSVQNSEFYKY